MTAKHTHCLLSYGPTSEIDWSAAALAFRSRGRFPITTIGARSTLAAVLDGTALGELLASDRPILVDDRPWGYRILEL